MSILAVLWDDRSILKDRASIPILTTNNPILILTLCFYTDQLTRVHKSSHSEFFKKKFSTHYVIATETWSIKMTAQVTKMWLQYHNLLQVSDVAMSVCDSNPRE